jgi:hypothetical protein
VSKAVSRLLLVEAGDDSNLSANLLERFLFSTDLASATNISASSFRYLKRTAENALLAPQKVGRATKNVLSPLCHMDILVPYGYETH